MATAAQRDGETVLGEVIAASTTQFTAQCLPTYDSGDAFRDLPDPPPFGAFVRIGPDVFGGSSPLPADFDPFEDIPAPGRRLAPTPASDTNAPMALYGIVCYAETGSLEPGRPLTAFGLDEDALRRDQPQIFELLATRFSATLIAYATGSDGMVRPHLPPRPPRPHARVYLASDAEIRQITERLTYLRSLLNSAAPSGVSADDLVAALLQHAWRAHNGDEAFLLRAGRELAALLPTDYDRLRTILNHIIS